jgi:hypothetical protein
MLPSGYDRGNEKCIKNMAENPLGKDPLGTPRKVIAL